MMVCMMPRAELRLNLPRESQRQMFHCLLPHLCSSMSSWCLYISYNIRQAHAPYTARGNHQGALYHLAPLTSSRSLALWGSFTLDHMIGRIRTGVARCAIENPTSTM